MRVGKRHLIERPLRIKMTIVAIGAIATVVARSSRLRRNLLFPLWDGNDSVGRGTKCDVTVHRGLSRFSRRKRDGFVKELPRRENGTVPLASREGDRSMFSACGLSAKYVFPPKNGPVPDRGVNAYHLIDVGLAGHGQIHYDPQQVEI